MPFKIDNAPLQKPDKPKQLRGLGDAVAVVAEPAKSFVQRFWADFFKDCNCEAKQKWMNEHFPFGKEKGTNPIGNVPLISP